MRRALLYSLAGILIGLSAPVFVFSHSSGCHSWHSCPSDSGGYVCGDKGYCSQCPDNQYCVGGSLRSSSTQVPTPATSAPPTSATTVPTPESASEATPAPLRIIPIPPPSLLNQTTVPIPAPTPFPLLPEAALEPPAQKPAIKIPLPAPEPMPALPTSADGNNAAVPGGKDKNTQSAAALLSVRADEERHAAAAVVFSPYLFFAASILIGLIAAAGFLFFRL